MARWIQGLACSNSGRAHRNLLEILSWPVLQELPAACHEAHVLRALAQATVSPASAELATRELAQACGVSRRTLEQAFRTCLHCSVSEYLRRARLNRVHARLHLPAETLEAIAADVGYSSLTALGRDFKRHTHTRQGRRA